MSMSIPPVTSGKVPTHLPAVSTPESSSSCCLIELVKSIFKTICCCFFGGDRPAPRPIPNPEHVLPSADEQTTSLQTQELPSNEDGWNAFFAQLKDAYTAHLLKEDPFKSLNKSDFYTSKYTSKITSVFEAVISSSEPYNVTNLEQILTDLIDVLNPSVTDLYNYLEIAVASNNVKAVEIMVQIWNKYLTLSEEEEAFNFKWGDRHREAFNGMVKGWTGYEVDPSWYVPISDTCKYLESRESYTYPPLLEKCSSLPNGAEILDTIWSNRKTAFLLNSDPTLRKLNASFLVNKIMKNDEEFVKILLKHGVSPFKRLAGKFLPENIGVTLPPGSHFDKAETMFHTPFALIVNSCTPQLAILILRYLRDEWLARSFDYCEDAEELKDALFLFCPVKTYSSANSIDPRVELLRNAFDQQIQKLQSSLPEGT